MNQINTQIEVIKNILDVPYKRRQRLIADCQRHAEQYANGLFWISEDETKYEGELAESGMQLRNSIVKRLQEFGDFDSMPVFIEWQGDPRGFVLYFRLESLTEEARTYCRDMNLLMDWGGNFTITLNSEQKKPKRHYTKRTA